VKSVMHRAGQLTCPVRRRMPSERARVMRARALQADAERLRAALASAEARADEAEGALAGAQAEVEIATRDLQARAPRAEARAQALCRASWPRSGAGGAPRRRCRWRRAGCLVLQAALSCLEAVPCSLLEVHAAARCAATRCA